MPSADTDLSLSLFSVTCAGVFGDGGGQEYMSTPTTVAPHIRGRPPGDIGYGMYPAQCMHVCVCVPTHVCVYTALRCMGLHVCQFAHRWHSYFNTLLKSQVILCKLS